MTGPHAAIFDVDGVLVDSYRAHFDSWRKLASQQQWTMTEAQFAATFGRTSREIIAELWSDGQLSDQRIAELDQRKESFYREILRTSFPEMHGAARLIDVLAEAGFLLAVGSSGPLENVQLVLDRVDPHHHIRAVVSGEDVTQGKPDPQVFQLAAQRLRIASDRCVVVEDAPPGVAAAHAAGMRCVALVSTGRTSEQLHEADLVVHDLTELSPHCLRQLIDGG